MSAPHPTRTGQANGSGSELVPLVVVIVNYRTPELTLECVRSLASAAEELPGLRAVIVDNGSHDGSVERLRQRLGDPMVAGWTTLVETGENLGFAGGCNHGWRSAPESEFVLLLNSDARLRAGTIAYCLAKMRRESDIGALSCRLDNEDGSIQNVARKFPTPLRLLAMSAGLPWRLPRWFAWADAEDPAWDRATMARDVDWLGGAFLMVRGGLVSEIGLLDEDFFFYGEDIEFCHRVWRSGHRCHYDPTVSAVHLGGRSPTQPGTDDLWRMRQLWSARYLVLRKCRGRMAEAAVRVQDGLSWYLRAVRSRIRSGRGSEEHRHACTVLRSALGRSRSAERPLDDATPRRRLRVLFALPGIHRVERGAEIAFENLARHLAARPDCDVTLLGSGVAAPRTPYRTLRAACIDREQFRHFPRVPLMRNPFRYEEFTFLPGMWRAYRPEEFDVTVTCSFPFVSWALRAKRSKGRRPAHVFVTQNGDWAPQRRNSEFGSFSCEGLVCTNPEYFERHAAKWNAVLIPNGVDLQRFRPGTPDRESFGLSAEFTVALVVSSLTPNKRVLEAVRALAPDPHLHLVVAGRGHLKEELLALGAREMGARFHHLEVSSDRMGDLYRAADVLLHMSRTEPFGNIYPEALATGLPIVADDNETTRWIVEDEGRLVDTRKPAAVLAAVRAALDDGDVTAAARRRQLAERRFAWPAIADQYFAFLLSVALTKGTAELAAAPESDRDAPTPTTGSLR